MRTRLAAALAVSLGLSAGLLGGCVDTPDPCAGYRLACLAVTVEGGPKDVYQLLVSIEGYSSTTPLTPRKRPDGPLVYPLRFAVHFAEFDRAHRGEVTLEMSALDGDNEVRGSLRQPVKIDGDEKQRLSVTLGPPFDMARPPDLAKAADLREGADLGDMAGPAPADLADGGSGG